MSRSLAKASMEREEIMGDDPVSPNANYYNSSVMCVSILVVFEMENALDTFQPMRAIENILLPMNPRFSSIMVKDAHGISKWRRVQVKLEDHIKTPLFPAELESYDNYVQEYIEKTATDLLPQLQPLWELHVIKYPTKNAAGTILLKVHHAIGDGFSLMSGLFSFLQRAENPSLPLTMPLKENSKVQKRGVFRSLSNAFSMWTNTVRDFSWSIMSSTMADSRTPLRSGDFGIESRPIKISTVMFSLGEIKQIKTELKGTVNDVITGIIFYGIQLYLQAMSKGTKPAKTTCLVMLNTRAVRTYQLVKDMQKSTKSRWGNHFTTLHIPIPTNINPDKANAVETILKVKKFIKAKRNSLGIYLTAGMVELMRKIRGPEAVSRYLYNTIINTSMAMSNVIGPTEQFTFAGNPCKGFYFMSGRSPQSLMVAILSYMGMVRLAIGAERDFINSELLASCINKSFETTLEAVR